MAVGDGTNSTSVKLEQPTPEQRSTRVPVSSAALFVHAISIFSPGCSVPVTSVGSAGGSVLAVAELDGAEAPLTLVARTTYE